MKIKAFICFLFWGFVFSLICSSKYANVKDEALREDRQKWIQVSFALVMGLSIWAVSLMGE